MKTHNSDLRTGITCLLILLFSSCLPAQPEGIVKRSYRESWVRYLMADMKLGGDIEFYKKFTEDANSIEAIRRISLGDQVTNLDQFERKAVPGKNIRIVYKGTLETIQGSDIKLKSDLTLKEPEIRLGILALQLGADPGKIPAISVESISESLRRFSAEVRVMHADSFHIKCTSDKVIKISSITCENISGSKILLSSDISYDEDLVCYMLADMQLGGPVGFYEEIFNSWNDPNAGEAVRRWNNAERIKNIDLFARVELEGKGTKIVWKGSNRVISGNEVIIEKKSK